MTRTARTSESGGLLLVARSAMFSGVAVALAGAAHTIASGDSLSPRLLLGTFAVLTQLVVLLVPHERGFLPVAALLLLSQLVLHFVFAAFHAHPAVAADGSLFSGGIGPMGWGHLVAVLGSAWWLRRGEAHTCRFARGAVCAVSRPLTGLLALRDPQDVPEPPTSGCVTGERRTLASRAPGTSVRRRGPPAEAVAPTS